MSKILSEPLTESIFLVVEELLSIESATMTLLGNIIFPELKSSLAI